MYRPAGSCETHGGLSPDEADARYVKRFYIQKFDTNGRDRALRNQTTSRLLILPAELRNQIYDYAFGGFDIKFTIRGVHNLVYERNSETEGHKSQPVCTLIELVQSTTICRQIHFETALLPLLKNIILLKHSCGLQPILPRIPRSQQDAITKIRLQNLSVNRRDGWITSLDPCGLVELGGLREVIFELESRKDKPLDDLKDTIRLVFKETRSSRVKLVFMNSTAYSTMVSESFFGDISCKRGIMAA